MKQKLVFIFISAFTLNWVWEHVHSVFYWHYQGASITKIMLASAALFDAIVITIAAIVFLRVSYLRKRLWLIIPVGIMFAILLEWYALGTGRWAYKAAMPLVPFINTGLTPTVQLGILGYVVIKISDICLHRKKDLKK